MADFFLIFVVSIVELLSLFSVTEAYDVCYPGYSYSSTFTCYGDNEYCCNNDTDCCNFLSVGAIVGIVIGCLFAIGMVITFICICVQKSKRRPGVIVQPNQQATVAYVGYSGQTQYSQNQYGHQQYMTPPQYSQQQYTTPASYGQQQQQPPYNT